VESSRREHGVELTLQRRIKRLVVLNIDLGIVNAKGGPSNASMIELVVSEHVSSPLYQLHTIDVLESTP
jgi:hypothetical protein